MENISFQLSDDMKEKIINTIKNFWNWINDFIKRFRNWFEDICKSVDWIKYKKYLKHQKRVKNRLMLFAKRKCKYAR